MEAYRQEPWFRDPYAQRPPPAYERGQEVEVHRGEGRSADPYARPQPAHETDPQMEAYRGEPWFRDPYPQRPREHEPDPETEAYGGEPRPRDTYVRRPPEYEPDPWYQRYQPGRSYGGPLGSRAGRKAYTLRGVLAGAVLGGAAVTAARTLILDRPDVMATINSGVTHLSDHFGRLPNALLDAFWAHLPM
jgi:hypothetical protein